MILMIDNYDSFTYNLALYLRELDANVKVVRNDQISLEEIEALAPRGILISPGPCTPNEAGISLDVIRHFKATIPMLGVCLGHQSIGQFFGGRVIRAKQVMHGKVSSIYHCQQGVFSGLPSPFKATRYHSLVVELETLPDCFEITAWTQTSDGKINELMGIKHKHFELEGVQFHPEAILTEQGKPLLQNFLNGCLVQNASKYTIL